ncbi:hypothetical protein [Rhodoferax ferrireducens]|uniref:hypothetical protein n=1 Tax=Rhodoferax ferrireducens TaxID=192843 RepID=UPI000E0CD4DB|nr:hypothetical protein [Rhodoferax ferrireducens]
MLWRLKSYLRRLRVAMRPMRERGLGLVSVLMVHVPVAFLFRSWRVLAQPLNGGLIQRVFNQPRFVDFQDGLADSALPRFYVIVMPFTLHFLLPCLALLQGRAQVVLLENGIRHWERRVLTHRFPSLPMFNLWRLPFSSVAHGNVISLLLENHRGNFGIVDHDCYVFDEAVFDQLVPAADECLLSLFGEASRSLEITFPLTYFLFFNAEALRLLMRRYAVDARLYRETPASARDAMARIGLGKTTFWKNYHNFRDTLHVLLATAVAEGLKFRFLSSDKELPAMHIGGTSIGTHHTKDLYALYIHLRFLELLDDPLLSHRYAFLTAPLRSSAEALANGDPTNTTWQQLPVVESLMQGLRDALKDPARLGNAGKVSISDRCQR